MSNDRYERIRKALAMGPTKGPWGATHGDAYLIAACDPDTIRELLAERDQLATALDALQAEVGETKEVAVRAMRQRDAQYNRAERLAEALALLPDEIDMVENNPDEGQRMFCCCREVKGHWFSGLSITHDEDCWYARMRALRDHYQEEK